MSQPSEGEGVKTRAEILAIARDAKKAKSQDALKEAVVAEAVKRVAASGASYGDLEIKTIRTDQGIFEFYLYCHTIDCKSELQVTGIAVPDFRCGSCGAPMRLRAKKKIEVVE